MNELVFFSRTPKTEMMHGQADKLSQIYKLFQ